MIAVGAVEPPDVARMPVPAISSFASAEDFLIDSRSLAMCWRFLLQVPAFAFCHLMLITSTQAIFTLPVAQTSCFLHFTPHHIYCHHAILSVCVGHLAQAGVHLLQTEGSKMVMALCQSSFNQGVYGLVTNLGSLVVRTIFFPVEEAAFRAFSKPPGDALPSGRVYGNEC